MVSAVFGRALVSAVVAWGVPASFRPPPEPQNLVSVPGSKVEGAHPRKEIVPQIIRRHFDEVTASVRKSTLGNAYVESCIVAALRRWEFPKPLDHRPVNISYPFILSPPDPK